MPIQRNGSDVGNNYNNNNNNNNDNFYSAVTRNNRYKGAYAMHSLKNYEIK